MNWLEDLIDNMLRQESVFRALNNTNSVFPKYKITQTGEYNFVLELALAGYDKDKIEVTSVKNKLSISYKADTANETKEEKEEKEEKEYPVVLENHIAERAFEKIWVTNEQYDLSVKSVTMKDGILKVEIEIEVPETWKTKTYKVK